MSVNLNDAWAKRLDLRRQADGAWTAHLEHLQMAMSLNHVAENLWAHADKVWLSSVEEAQQKGRWVGIHATKDREYHLDDGRVFKPEEKT